MSNPRCSHPLVSGISSLMTISHRVATLFLTLFQPLDLYPHSDRLTHRTSVTETVRVTEHAAAHLPIEFIFMSPAQHWALAVPQYLIFDILYCPTNAVFTSVIVCCTNNLSTNHRPVSFIPILAWPSALVFTCPNGPFHASNAGSNTTIASASSSATRGNRWTIPRLRAPHLFLQLIPCMRGKRSSLWVPALETNENVTRKGTRRENANVHANGRKKEPEQVPELRVWEPSERERDRERGGRHSPGAKHSTVVYGFASRCGGHSPPDLVLCDELFLACSAVQFQSLITRALRRRRARRDGTSRSRSCASFRVVAVTFG